MPEVKIYENAADFLLTALPYLSENEAENNLILGLAIRIMKSTKPMEPRPLLATVENEGALEAAALMTPPRSMVLASFVDEDLESLQALADRLWQEGWQVSGVNAKKETAEKFAALWTHRATLKAFTNLNQRVYRLQRVIEPPMPAGHFRPAYPQDEALLAAWANQFMLEALGESDPETVQKIIENRIREGELFVWQDGEIVSMAARTRETPHGVVVSLVYTPPAERGKGYASALVARLSQHLLDSGFQFCALFTDLSNPTSNKIYQAIGYEAVCDMDELRFSKELDP